ncbi:RidA family protein [Planobispora longispora]|uniref:Translation initiation inhibitor n=1 Tax=Planobispora longispora TaxID=28887 RepID=A0A8J3W763_9ACTN|nr:RidA family protein [Planobispora longispora]BFE88029.1 RidA family protein [Planobispora longispora]GIH77521.1 translation initiation inhibitor [Planobispora longispora]
MAFSINPVDPAELPESSPAYTHGTLVHGAQRTLYISGQPPWTTEGDIPDDFAGQCRLAWDNVNSVLTAADMTVRNLAKVTVYLSDRRYREANSRIRHEVLGDHCPAITIIITDIYDEAWLLEIEAIAVAPA